MSATEAPMNGQSELGVVRQLREIVAFGWRYVGSRKGMVSGYLALSAAEKFTMIGVPVLFGQIVDVLEGGRPTSGSGGVFSDLRWLSAAWLSLLAIGILLSYSREIVRARLDGLMMGEIRDDLFSSYLSQHPPFFHAHGPGKLAAIVNQMSSEAQHAIREVLIEPVIQIIAVAGTAWAILQAASGTTAPAIAIALIVTLPVLYLINMVGKGLGRVSEASREQTLAIATLVDSALQSPEEVQAFGAEAALRRKHLSAVSELMRTRLQQASTVARLNTVDGLPTVVVQAVLVICALYLSPETVRAGGLVAMVLLTRNLVEPIQVLGAFVVTAVCPGQASIRSVRCSFMRSRRMNLSGHRCRTCWSQSWKPGMSHFVTGKTDR